MTDPGAARDTPDEATPPDHDGSGAGSTPTAGSRDRPDRTSDLRLSDDDRDVGWGDDVRPEERDERWWRDQRPPHWD